MSDARFLGRLILLGVCMIPVRLLALSVSPGRTEVLLRPGEQIKSAITITNDEKEDLQITVSSRDWFLLPANKEIHVKDWLVIHGPTQFILKAKQSRRLKITIKSPAKAEGELVAMVSFRYVTENASSMITPMISVSIYNGIAGTQKKQGEVLTVDVHSFPGSVQPVASAWATGNIHIRPRGTITVAKTNGEKVLDCAIKEGDPSYPGMEKGYFCSPINQTLSPGDYRLTADFNDGEAHFSKERLMTVGGKGNITFADVASTVQTSTATSVAVSSSVAKSGIPQGGAKP